MTPFKAVIDKTTHNIRPLDTTQVGVPSNVNLIEIRDPDTDKLKWQNYVPAGVTLDLVSSEKRMYGIILGDTKLRSLGASSTTFTASASQWWWWVIGAVTLALIVIIIILAVFLSKRNSKKNIPKDTQYGGRRYVSKYRRR